MKNKKWLQIIILLGILLVGVFTVGASFFDKDPAVKPGKDAPEFTLKGLDGRDWTLSELKGQPVVLNFWGTFCPPCVREMPALQKQYDKWKDSGVIVLGANVNESPITVKAFINQHKIKFPILLDNDQTRKRYKVTAFPTTFYIDAQGEIQDVFVGEMTEDHIYQRISKLVSK